MPRAKSGPTITCSRAKLLQRGNTTTRGSSRHAQKHTLASITNTLESVNQGTPRRLPCGLNGQTLLTAKLLARFTVNRYTLRTTLCNSPQTKADSTWTERRKASAATDSVPPPFITTKTSIIRIGKTKLLHKFSLASYPHGRTARTRTDHNESMPPPPPPT